MLLKNDLLMWSGPVEFACELYEVGLIFCSYSNNTGKNKPLRKGYIIEAHTLLILPIMRSFYNLPAFPLILHFYGCLLQLS